MCPFIYLFNFSGFFFFSKYRKLFFGEEELQKRAAAAFEVPTSLKVVEYEQTLLPVSVSGAIAHVGKTKPDHRGSPAIKRRRSKDNAGRVSACGSGSQLRCEADSELHGAGAAPAGFARELDLPVICSVLLRFCLALGDFVWEEAT